MFIGKLIFGLLIAHLAKWLDEPAGIGLIIGVFFGHLIDILISKKINEWHYKRVYLKKAQDKANKDFLYCLFTLAGKVCASDDDISKEEHDCIKKIISERLNLGRKDKKIALGYFDKAIKQQVTEQNLASKLVDMAQNSPDLLKNIILLLREVAECDGSINKDEYRMLFTLSTIFGFDPEISNKLIGKSYSSNQKTSKSNASKESKSNENQTETELSKNLKILGCKPGDTNDKIKKAYRELVSKFHPDKISSKDLPEDFIEFATNKLTEVRYAYEKVKELKGF